MGLGKVAELHDCRAQTEDLPWEIRRQEGWGTLGRDVGKPERISTVKQDEQSKNYVSHGSSGLSISVVPNAKPAIVAESYKWQVEQVTRFKTYCRWPWLAGPIGHLNLLSPRTGFAKPRKNRKYEEGSFS